MEFEMTVFPGLNEDGALTVKRHYQQFPYGLLFLGTEHRLRITRIGIPGVLRDE